MRVVRPFPSIAAPIPKGRIAIARTCFGQNPPQESPPEKAAPSFFKRLVEKAHHSWAAKLAVLIIVPGGSLIVLFMERKRVARWSRNAYMAVNDALRPRRK
ncbi:MAG: hypothetical protein K2X01_09140 [Cyanobacteria bacterium]|nr:hypothetical protein [Cyanobacteriota bacterium]